MIKIIGLRGYEYEVEPKQFPDGTLKLNLPTITPSQIAWYYENDAELFTLMCVRKFYHNYSISLFMPYIPHARMDRVKNEDEVFTLKYFCEIINSLNFTKIYVYDPHSNVSKALLNNVEEISIFDIVMLAFNDATKDCGEQPVFFFPDEGAMKRYSSMFNAPYAFGMKRRNWEDGKILGLDIINADVVKDKNVFIVDDICSKGGTFYHAAKALKAARAKNVYLYVTHLESTVLAGDMYADDDLIKHIYCANKLNDFEDVRNKITAYNAYLTCPSGVTKPY